MRIAMLTNNYKPFIGGVPISIERLANGLRKQGHEVYIFAPSYENQVEEEFVIRCKVMKKKISNGKIVVPNMFDSKVEKIFKELNVDIIHVHHPILMGNVGLHLGKKYNIPVAFTYHTRYEQYLHHLKIYREFEDIIKSEDNVAVTKIGAKILDFTHNNLIPGYVKFFSNKCDLVFAPTKLIKEYLIDTDVVTRIEVMPTGIEESYFCEKNIESQIIRERYIGSKKYLFCTVSRLSKEKNIEFIIDGLQLLKDKKGDCFNMIIIGDGPSRQELEERVRENGLENNVTFIDSVDNSKIGNYYRACDMFLFASQSETQGIVLLEAMAAKNPVVAINASGVCDIVRNGYNGYMTTSDVCEWVEKICYVMEEEKHRNTLRLNAYNTAREYLNSNIAQIAEYNYSKLIRSYSKEGYNYEYKAI